jgi:16S rRNA (cytosine967-C5)-methyltransferase
MTHAPEVLLRASRPGRTRGIGLELYTAALANPGGAGGIWRRGLREARALHSAERRLVADALPALARQEAQLDRRLGTSEPLARWLGLLVSWGLDPAAASEAAEAEGLVGAAFTACGALDHPDDDLAVRASVPGRVADELRRALGDEAGIFLMASASRAPVVLRVPAGVRDGLVFALADEGAVATSLAPTGIALPAGTDVRALKPLRQVAWELQDEASQVVAGLVTARAGGRVLDLCAGAGGKSLAIAAQRRDLQVFATDVRQRPLDELQHRAKEAGLTIRTRQISPEGPLDLTPFDVVLVDAPCSGTGTWRRHPELRWRLGGLDDTTALQRAILRRAAPLVAPGGLLIYATCSVLPCEDEDVVADLLAHDPAWEVVTPDVPTAARAGAYVRTWPHRHGTDGFFAATLRRKETSA